MRSHQFISDLSYRSVIIDAVSIFIEDLSRLCVDVVFILRLAVDEFHLIDVYAIIIAMSLFFISTSLDLKIIFHSIHLMLPLDS